MTVTVERTAVRVIGSARLLAGLDRFDRLDLARHREVHGPYPTGTRAELERLTSAVGLRGRGGAGFPVARKLAALPSRVHAVVVNGSESEPASLKDRALLTGVPHLVLDGAAAVATAVGARRVVIAVHDAVAAASVRAALAERDDLPRAEVVQTAGGFVGGEARALLRGLSGGPAVPQGRRVLPSEQGLDGRPTFLSNAETFAQLAILVRYGARRYSETGLPDEPGTQLLTVGGAVEGPGVLEVPNGVPLDVVLRSAGAVPGGVLLGGYHGRWLPDGQDLGSRYRQPGVQTNQDLPLSRTTGSGIVLALGRETCALGEVQRVAAWLAAESAGQCGPCVFGLPAIAADLAALVRGEQSDAPRHLGLVSGRGACAHPDGAVRFVTSALEAFADEVALHRRGGCGRPVLGVLPLGGVS